MLADAKRGDIDVSATAYAQALLGSTPSPFGELPGLGADALTVSAYMGRTRSSPSARSRPRPAPGCSPSCGRPTPGPPTSRTSSSPAAGRVWEAVARMVARLGRPGPASGLSDVGAVVGATVPQHLARARELMPHAPFLLPGIGAQGGRVEDVAPAFAPGRAAALVTASRSIVHAHEAAGAPDDPATAARAEAERLRAQAWALPAG